MFVVGVDCVKALFLLSLGSVAWIFVLWVLCGFDGFLGVLFVFTM